MANEIIIAIISAVVGGIVTLLTTLLLDRRKEKREDRLEARKERKEIFQNRPEMKIVSHKDYLSRVGYGIKQQCDIELFVAKIDHVTTGKKKHDIVEAHYKEADLNSEEWCCVIYTFRNAGKTDISTLHIISHYQKDTCVFPSKYADQLAKGGALNYSYCHDTKIRVGDSITVKLCYHKDCVATGVISATMSIGMEDDNGRHWIQPLFAPLDKVYDSREISCKEYHEAIRTDNAEECFKRPWLW